MNHGRIAVMLSAAMLLTTAPAYAENATLEGEQQEEAIISENLSRSEHSGDGADSSDAWSASLSFGFSFKISSKRRIASSYFSLR